MPNEIEPNGGISRRRMLKRIGIGAAVTWSAPILTSIRTPAFAQQYECGCPPFNCQTPSFCDNGCFCAPHHGGGPCVCFYSGTCYSDQPICVTDQDCVDQFGPGLVCADVDPVCSCAGNVACLDTGPCPSGHPKGIRKG